MVVCHGLAPSYEARLWKSRGYPWPGSPGALQLTIWAMRLRVRSAELVFHILRIGELVGIAIECDGESDAVRFAHCAARCRHCGCGNRDRGCHPSHVTTLLCARPTAAPPNHPPPFPSYDRLLTHLHS